MILLAKRCLILYIKIIMSTVAEYIESKGVKLIFDRFRQVDKSLTRSHEGSGIGLSIVKGLVDLQGGQITVNSEYGKGSEFKMEFPVKVLDIEEENCKIAADQIKIDQVSI
jgi:signal transduction histidine kinase